MNKLQLYQSAFAAASATLDLTAGAGLDAKTAELAVNESIPDSQYVTWKAYVISFRSQMLGLRNSDQIASKLQANPKTIA